MQTSIRVTYWVNEDGAIQAVEFGFMGRLDKQTRYVSRRDDERIPDS
ncbi:MAG: hypothetical protein ACJ0HT_06640 [Alphaproteobacteria bacterium]